MKKEIAKKWAEALRSGEYEQGTRVLNKYGKFCCLGVLCDLYQKEVGNLNVSKTVWGTIVYQGIERTLPPQVQEWAEIRSPSGQPKYSNIKGARALTELNDAYKLSFDEIAAYIEADWEHL
jgi:hypothetical protein